jgi:hypothetical protein
MMEKFDASSWNAETRDFSANGPWNLNHKNPKKKKNQFSSGSLEEGEEETKLDIKREGKSSTALSGSALSDPKGEQCYSNPKILSAPPTSQEVLRGGTVPIGPREVRDATNVGGIERSEYTLRKRVPDALGDRDGQAKPPSTQSTGGAAWDQFSGNERRFGITANFDEKIDKSHLGYKQGAPDRMESILEHLKQTGSVDGIPKIPPLQHTPSNKSSSTTSPPSTASRAYRPPSPAESRDSGFHDDYPMIIERERKPYTAAPGTGKIYSRDIRNPYSPPLRRRNSYSEASVDSGFHDDPTRLESIPNKYGGHPPLGSPPIERRAGDRRATDRYERRGAEDENSSRDAERSDRYQGIPAWEPDRFDRPYERSRFAIDPRNVWGAPPDQWYRDNGRPADYDGGDRRYIS